MRSYTYLRFYALLLFEPKARLKSYTILPTRRQRPAKYRRAPETSKMWTVKHQRSEQPRCSAPETRERNCHPLRVANHRLYPLRPARCRISSALRSKLCWSLHSKIAPHVSHNKAKKGLYFGQQHIFPACPVPVQAMYCTAWPCSRITWSTKPLQAEIQAVSTPTRASQVFVIPKCDFTRQ